MFQHLLRPSAAVLVSLVAADCAWAAAALTRNPYLQRLGRTQVTLMWRTATPAQQSIDYSTDATYGLTYQETAPTRNHEITLTGLAPGATYNYRLREGSEILLQGSGFTFKTDLGLDDPEFTFFVTGDVGEDEPAEARQHYTQNMIRRVAPRADFGLLCGDNVYPDGESAMYDSVLMRPWRDLLCNTTVWPCLGNHDWHVDPDSNFAREWSLPNNEHYYSFDYGNAHFIALDTADAFLYDEANQLAWLENDLANARGGRVWTIVYFHHPLLTCTYKGNEPEMSSKLFPIFERYDVDVVFTGHAHTYERLYPIHAGLPVDQAQNPAYQDPQGTVYVVTGCGGKFKVGEPTTFCGPTAAYVDERILFTQAFVYDHLMVIATFDSFTGAMVDYVQITKSQTTSNLAAAPVVRRLGQNVPNPFNPTTLVPFELASPGRTLLRVFRPDGAWVADLADRVFPAGAHRLEWNGRDHAGKRVASGVYVLRLQAPGVSESIKMMLVR